LAIAPSSNVKMIAVKPATKNGLMLHYWYRFKLAKLLKKYAADIFITDSGASCSSALPQLLWVDDISFLQKQSKGHYHPFWKKYFAASAANAARIISPQPFIKASLTAKFPALANKINFIPLGLDHAHQLPDAGNKQPFLNNFSQGIDYFLAEIDEKSSVQLTVLLKAFSLFKKRLKSSMKLVLNMHQVKLDDHVKDFRLYKYREDVIITNVDDATDQRLLLANAYAGIYLPGQVQKANALGLKILQSGIPLIVTDLSANREIYENAVLYVSLQDASIAEQMMKLYKDEAEREQFIRSGLELSKFYDKDSAGAELWQTILWHASYKAH